MRVQLKPIEQQVVAVVGASSGIGRETALRLARRGAKVVVAARSEPGLQSLVREIERGGGEATAVVADVADFAQVEAIADRAVAAYGRLDSWVHLAAVALYGLLYWLLMRLDLKDTAICVIITWILVTAANYIAYKIEGASKDSWV